MSTGNTRRHHRCRILIFQYKRQQFAEASQLLLSSAYFLKPYFFSQFPGFAYNVILVSMMKDVFWGFFFYNNDDDILQTNN